MRKTKKIFTACIVLVFLSVLVVYKTRETDRVTATDTDTATDTATDTEGFGRIKLWVDEANKINLRILYAGHPDSKREKEFVQFLTSHFSKVETGDLATFQESQAESFDVIILDYDGDGFNAPRLQLSPEYARPTVTVGVAGAFICSNMSLKTGYL